MPNQRSAVESTRTRAFPGVNERIRHAGQIVFGPQRVGRQRFRQKARKPALQFGQNGRPEAPQIHRNRSLRGQGHKRFSAVFGIGRAAAMRLNARALDDLLEIAILPHLAHAARNRAVFRQRVGEPVAHHGVFTGVARRGEEIANRLKRRAAVKIIRVDNRERAVKICACAQHRVAGSPGLDAPLGHAKAFGKHFHALKSVLHVHMVFDTPPDDFAEVALIFGLDNAYHAPKARANGVENGKINNGMPASSTARFA